MVEVLSKAKIQSVKEIKKQARIKKRNKKFFFLPMY